jgi:hypothetical protein
LLFRPGMTKRFLPQVRQALLWYKDPTSHDA